MPPESVPSLFDKFGITERAKPDRPHNCVRDCRVEKRNPPALELIFTPTPAQFPQASPIQSQGGERSQRGTPHQATHVDSTTCPEASRVQYLEIKDGAEQKHEYHVGENLLFRRRGHHRFLGQEQYNARLASATRPGASGLLAANCEPTPTREAVLTSPPRTARWGALPSGRRTSPHWQR